jgi:hypothetical protein
VHSIEKTLVQIAVAGTAAVAFAACGSPDAPRNGTAPDIQIVMPVHALEPGSSMQATARAVTGSGAYSLPADRLVWTSSDSMIASVSRGVITAHQLGKVIISVSIDGKSAAENVSVEWQQDAYLAITVPADTVGIGGSFQAQALVRGRQRVTPREWTSSDTGVATVDSLGVVIAHAAGRSTISARFVGLVGSVTVQVSAVQTGQGYGYVYSFDIPNLEAYDIEYDWTPPPDHGYSTSVGLQLNLMPPYPITADFGWVGPSRPTKDVMLQLVPFDPLPCAAYLNDRLDYTWVVLGVPQANCFDRGQFRFSDRVELIAIAPGAIEGAVAMVRPGIRSAMSSGTPIKEVSVAAGTRDYEVQGLTRDSLYWFVTPAFATLGSCSVAPAGATPPSATARVVCRDSDGKPADSNVYAIGLGADAARGRNPHGLIEIDGFARVLRKTTTDLDIAVLGPSTQALRTFQITITGARLAEFARLPAVFVTPVSSTAPVCWMIDITRVGSTQVMLDVSCAALVDGVLVGVFY